MKITVEVSNLSEIEKIFSFFQNLKLEKIQVFEDKKAIIPKIEKGDKSINPKDLFGIWKENPKKIEEIRLKAWKRP